MTSNPLGRPLVSPVQAIRGALSTPDGVTVFLVHSLLSTLVIGSS
jgi:hypothetical protein